METYAIFISMIEGGITTKQNAEILRIYLEEYLRHKGVSVRKPFRCLSPDHEDTHPSMSLNRLANNVHCFACGVTYDLFDLIGMDYGLMSFHDRLKKAAQLFEEDYQIVANQPLVPCSVQLHKPVRSTPPLRPDRTGELAMLRKEATPNCPYLTARGITRESIEHHQLFETDLWAYFPVYEEGCCVGWCARAVPHSVSPRYQNATGSLGIWNGDKLKTDGVGGRLFLTEGIVDAICLEQMGHDSVALCGSQNTAKLLRLCEANAGTANTWRFVSCGDPDPAGARMNQILMTQLKAMGLSCTVLALPDGSDLNTLYLQHKDRLTALLSEEEPADRSGYETTSAAGALETFFHGTHARLGQVIETGFDGLDYLLDGGLYPGLYVVGAISSVGKTSFVLQIADHIAHSSNDVLYITLEQSKQELLAKSLSRTSAGLAQRREHAFTVRQILGGASTFTASQLLLLQRTRQVYQTAAAGLYIREGIADIGVGNIRTMVREHVAARGKPPVVVVDYLQILAPSEQRATDKQNTDRSVLELKRLSRDFEIPVVVISSFNRENYRTAVSMEAFKESGAVEYSADVLLGLQLRGVGEKEFCVNAAKLEQPRQLELVLLKNRNGIPYAKLPLEYDARCNLFWETKQPGKRKRPGIR